MTAETVSTVKSEGKELKLLRRGDHYEIIYNGIFLMATYGGKSEQEMVADALFYVSQNKLSEIRVLLGGLGVGYSLMPAVEDDRVSQIDVVELEQEIIDWNFTYFRSYNQNVLENEKVSIVQKDIFDFLKDYLNKNHGGHGGFRRQGYDLVILDIDNGPDWLVKESNALLYQKEGLELVKQSMSTDGLVVIWAMNKEVVLENALLSHFHQVFSREYLNEDHKGRIHKDCVYFGARKRHIHSK